VGVDFAGTIVKFGPGVDEKKINRKIGDRVSSFIYGGVYNSFNLYPTTRPKLSALGGGPNGSFAEYLVAPDHMLIKVPDEWTSEDAAGLAASAFTTSQMFWESQELPKINLSEQTISEHQLDLLIWGGASSTGHYAIQFAKLTGLRSIVTASPKHFDRLKKLGADVLFDYNDPEVVNKVREATGGKLKNALDCISEEYTFQKVIDSLSDDGGVISTLSPYQKELKKGVTVTCSFAYSLLGPVSEGCVYVLQ
jgi:NADPH:quinone reductase-like Zn-dependent oxidoreductase